MRKKMDVASTLKRVTQGLGWPFHNIIVHPTSEVLRLIGLKRVSQWLHDSTVPTTSRPLTIRRPERPDAGIDDIRWVEQRMPMPDSDDDVTLWPSGDRRPFGEGCMMSAAGIDEDDRQG